MKTVMVVGPLSMRCAGREITDKLRVMAVYDPTSAIGIAANVCPAVIVVDKPTAGLFVIQPFEHLAQEVVVVGDSGVEVRVFERLEEGKYAIHKELIRQMPHYDKGADFVKSFLDAYEVDTVDVRRACRFGLGSNF